MKTKKKTIKAWADVGSNGGIFEFRGGPVAYKYPNLLHIYNRKAAGRVPVKITYEVKK